MYILVAGGGPSVADARVININAVYGKYFDTNGPTRTTVQAVLPRDGLLVEIRCLAVMPER